LVVICAIIMACNNPTQAQVEVSDRDRLINMLNTRLPDVDVNVDKGVAYGNIYTRFSNSLSPQTAEVFNEHLGTLNISATELATIIQELGIGEDILTIPGDGLGAEEGMLEYLMEVVIPRVQAAMAANANANDGR